MASPPAAVYQYVTLPEFFLRSVGPPGFRLVRNKDGSESDNAQTVKEFENLAEADWYSASWKVDYNEERPHSSLGYQTPAEFARRCAASAPASATPPPALQQHSDLTQPVLS